MNTLHHLENPEICLSELIRVHSGKKSLIIGDFNETGFSALQKAHKVLYDDDHPKGKINIKKIKEILIKYYLKIKEINTELNHTIIANKKILRGN